MLMMMLVVSIVEASVDLLVVESRSIWLSQLSGSQRGYMGGLCREQLSVGGVRGLDVLNLYLSEMDWGGIVVE